MPEGLKFWKHLSPFTKAAFKRALKTVAQTALALLLTHDRISVVDWRYVIDAASMAGLLSILTSVSAGVPESPLQRQDEIAAPQSPLQIQEGGASDENHGPDEHA
ncbi:MAG: hypothetical protein IJQ81_12025 [Oscillibacter sp.]|nr:hypothetical protein [Oscillibacter sp.]